LLSEIKNLSLSRTSGLVVNQEISQFFISQKGQELKDKIQLITI